MKKFTSVLFVLLLVIVVAGGGVLPLATVVLAGNGVQVSLNAPAEVLQSSNLMASGNTATATLTGTLGALYKIVVSPATANVSAGYTTNFIAEGFDQDNNTLGIITTTCAWSSSDTSIASIQTAGQANPGRATGYRPGSVTITAKREGISGTAKLTVTAAELKEIAVTPVDSVITHLGTQQFRARAIYSDGSIKDITKDAIWISSNTSVATINTTGQANPGLATSVAPGTTTITAKLAGITSLGVALKVTNATLQELQVTPDPAPATVAAGLSKQFKAMGSYSDNPGVFNVDRTKFVDWSSSNTTVARIKAAGLATSYAAGTTVITATSGTVTGNITLMVTTAELMSIKITPVNPAITFVSCAPGTSATPPLQFIATGIYTDGSTVALTGTATWTSSITTVADNPPAGLVTTKKDGTTTISATDVGTGISGNTLLTVLPDKVAPVIKLTNPSDGLVLSIAGNLTVSGSVNDVNTVSVNVTDATGAVTITVLAVNPATGAFSGNVTVKIGSNTILVRAVDPAGNTGTSGTRTVLVDPMKPSITITSPVEGLVTNNPILNVSGSIVGATSATLKLNGKVVATISGSFTQAITLTDGKNSIVVSGYATGAPPTNAYLGTSGVRTVTLDRKGPTITIDSPASNSVVNTAGITVSGMVDDPGVSTANLTLNGVWQIIPTVGGSFSQNVKLADTTNNITVTAKDTVGNPSEAISVKVKFDSKAPEVRLIEPKNNALTNVASQLVTGIVYDPWITTAIIIVNGSPQPIDVAPDGSFSTIASLKADFVNTIEVTAIDEAGNPGTSGVVKVESDLTPPKLTIDLSDPTDSMTITVASNEALRAKPVVSANATAIDMTLVDINRWTGIFGPPITAGQYIVTANATGKAGNPSVARATFAKQTVTIAESETKEVSTETTRLEIATTANVTDASVSVTSTLENPAGNVENPAGAEAGLFIEITASPELRDNLESIYVRVDYDEADIIARGIGESTLKLCLWNTTTGEWELVPVSGVNTVENYVFGTITHLSKYGAFGMVVVIPPVVVPPVVPPPVVSLNAPAEVLQSSNFTATVNISQVIDLNGAQYDILFDPSVLTVDNVTAGQIDSTVMPVQGFTVVSSGRYRVLQARLEPPYTVNGTGYLAVLHFHVVGSLGDNSTIDLANGILSGWEGEIPATWVGDSVQVATEALPSPQIIAPALGAVGVPIWPTFTWTEVVGATGYEFVIGTDSTFAIVDLAINTQANAYAVTEPLLYSTTYYWRVKAIAAGATSGWVTGSFTTEIKRSTVEINNGNTITLVVGGNIIALTTSGIPIAVKGLPDLGAPANGLASFTFDFSWDKNVIRVDSIRKSSIAVAEPQDGGYGWTMFVGTPDNVNGTVRVAGYTTTFSTADITLFYFGITAVGSAGSSTSINVTITNLYDKNNITIPARPVNAPVKIASLMAETSIAQAKASDGIVVVRINIDRIKDLSGNTAAIPGGIGSYTAVATANSSDIKFITVRGVPPFANPTFDNVTGIFSATTNATPQQAATVAAVVPILTGNTTTRVSLTAAFQVIGAAGEPGLRVSEEHPNSITFQRGDTSGDGKVDIGDASWIAQYVVGMRVLNEINALNAASVSHGAGAGDLIDIGDASWIAQKVVGMRDAYFQPK